MKEIKISTITDKNNNVIGYETSGLDKYSSEELKINIPLDYKISEYILNQLSSSIMNGNKIKDGDSNPDLLTTTIFFKKKDNTLIVVFPDVRMNYPWDENCDKMYKNQI